MPIINMEKTGKNIERLRRSRGLSVRDMQEAFGFTSPCPIYKWQHGENLPALENLVVLAALFEVRMDDLIVTD